MATAKELMRAGELFPGDDPDLNRELDRRQAMVAALNATTHERQEERYAALAELLAEIGEGTFIRPPFYCDYGDGIRIGDECLLGPGVQLITATHPVDPGPRRAAWEQALPVTLADGVWLGSGVIVCPGASIGENTVVGAGAIVTRDLPAGVVAYGNPARVIREIDERDRRQPG